MALRNIAILMGLALVLTCWVNRADAGIMIGSRIAQTAKSYVGSYLWTVSSSHGPGVGKYKCNYFVADVLEKAGAVVPQRNPFRWSPFSANEWNDPSAWRWTFTRCWDEQTTPEIGDVVSNGAHVGIVTGQRSTTSAPVDDPVVTNDFGFLGNPVTFFRHRDNCN